MKRTKKAKKLIQLADLVTEGKPFSEAVREVGTFPKYVGDMIETGEETGRLEQSFQALADYYDRQQQLMSQIRSALLYPFILMILMLVILVVLLVKVLPIFNQVYEQLAVRWAARRSFYCGLATGSEVHAGVVRYHICHCFSGSSDCLQQEDKRLFCETV